MLRTVRAIVAAEGLRGLYHGAGPTLLQILPYTGLMYYSYEVAKSTLRALPLVPCVCVCVWGGAPA